MAEYVLVVEFIEPIKGNPGKDLGKEEEKANLNEKPIHSPFPFDRPKEKGVPENSGTPEIT